MVGVRVGSILLGVIVGNPFCVFHKALLLPTYPLSPRRNKYKIFGLGSTKDMDFLHGWSAKKK
jgi:hypothetical protein